MKRIFLRVGAGLAVFLVLAGGGLAGVTVTQWDRTFEAPYPEIAATADPEVVEYGRYLVYGPMHCAYCHTSKEQWPAIDAGETPPLAGGYSISIPPGTFYAPNLTPDPETGIGGRTDGELARLIRHQVRADGRVAIPFMEFQGMSDADLRAVISFLRSQEPVRNPVPDHELTFIGRTILATVMKPKGPEAAPPSESPPVAPTLERGEYLAHVAAQCAGCHTERNQVTGAFTGPAFAGGSTFPSDTDPAVTFVTPNLTPHAGTGVMSKWTEEQFITRFRAGPVLEGSPMPWGAFERMADDDLRALYRYLDSLDPVEHEVVTLLREGE